MSDLATFQASLTNTEANLIKLMKHARDLAAGGTNAPCDVVFLRRPNDDSDANKIEFLSQNGEFSLINAPPYNHEKGFVSLVFACNLIGTSIQVQLEFGVWEGQLIFPDGKKTISATHLFERLFPSSEYNNMKESQAEWDQHAAFLKKLDDDFEKIQEEKAKLNNLILMMNSGKFR